MATAIRWNGAWLPLGGEVELPDPEPEEPTEPGGPGEPGTFTHGSELAATSAAVASQIGPSGTLTPWTGSNTLSGTQVIENRVFNNIITIPAGADITLRNCRIIGPLGQTTYTIRAQYGGGLRLTLEDCEVIARTTSASSPRCIAMWGDGNIKAVRTIFRGGIDNLYMNPNNSPGVWETGDPFVPLARVFLQECWFGDLQRVASSHTDCIQFDGGGYAFIDRIRLMSYSIPGGSDPLNARVTNPATNQLGGGGLIATQNSSNPNKVSHIRVKDSWFEGGNYTVDLSPSDGLPPGPAAMTGCLFGVRSRFGPLRLPGGSTNNNNRWGQSGTTEWATPVTVTEGDLLPGSTGA